MQTAEIRRRFLSHFEQRGHTVVPSAPLLLDDPTLLFVNAGMVPFKPYFLGQETPPYPRAASVQKCVRTLDIDEVGKTTRHGTFFQMNGNFSFGDYFKEGAISNAWELMTSSQADGGLGFDESRLWVTVYEEDEEAHDLWRRIAGLPEERIVREGRSENFWSMGVPGPCGPDSEIFYDTGPEFGLDGGPAVDENRYLEIWNLVFMQFERGEGDGKDGYEIVGDLPAHNIDTGMGLERVAFLLQGVPNLYEIDQVRPVLDRAAELAGKRYGGGAGSSGSESHEDDVRLRVIADHVRSGLMLASDGVVPGNEARGYVLRRLLRRVVRSMRLLGVDDPVLPELVTVSKGIMVHAYPELEATFPRVRDLFRAEEEAFRRTLATGTTILDTAVRDAKAGGSRRIEGAAAFALHDTYGFPIELTLEAAHEQGVEVDEDGFRRLMTEQRERARAATQAKKSGYADLGEYRELADSLARPVEFTGYTEVVSEGTVAGIVLAGARVGAAREGDEVEVVLDRTPFYAEGGGQKADHGVIELDGARLEVLDVQAPVTGLVVHRVRVLSGEVVTGAGAQGQVDVERRRSISRSHTATHMVHKAIRDALGEHATQAGSENSPGRFRFDFNATSAVPASVLADVEARVNALLIEDLAVTAEVLPIDEAVRSGAMGLFTDKYGDEVRVVSVGDWTRELCGGTHAQRSGQIGLVTLLGESSIGSGVRRVEALVASDAHRFLAREHAVVGRLTEMLKGKPEELPDRVGRLMEQLRAADKELAALRGAQALAAAGALAEGARDVGGTAYVGHRAPDGTTADDLRALAADVRNRLGATRPVVVAVAAVTKDRPLVVVAVNEAGRTSGLRAGELVRAAAQAMGGNGGGKDDMAQGGGSDPSSVEAALGRVAATVTEKVAVP